MPFFLLDVLNSKKIILSQVLNVNGTLDTSQDTIVQVP